MDPPPTSFTGRRRSSVIDPNAPPFLIPSSSPAPRKASTWDSTPAPSGYPVASDIASRRSSEATSDYSDRTPKYSGADNISSRKASAWDDPLSSTSSLGTSASDIAQRRATALDRSPWDAFAGAPPGNEGSTWGWMSDIIAMTSDISTSPLSNDLTSDRIRLFYSGNINYIFEIYNDQSLPIVDIEAIMYAYGVESTCIQIVMNQVDPQKHGIINVNHQNKQNILALTIKFASPTEPLFVLRHASNCLQKKLLSPLHFAGYIIHVLKGKYLGGEPRFMILGMQSILGVLEGSSNRKISTKDVITFTRMWRVLDSDGVQDLFDLINDDYNGSISCINLYNLLYRRNGLGKQRIDMFDTLGKQNPLMFFPLIDKDEDGILSSDDLHQFAAIFGRFPPQEVVDRLIHKLDMDGDGKVTLEDFGRIMVPIIDGITWEFWLVALLLTLEL